MVKKLTIVVLAVILGQNLGYSQQRSGVVTMEQFKNELLIRVNKLRQRGCNCGNMYMPPVNPIAWNAQLQFSASVHARDMATQRYFSHESIDGKSVKDRIYNAGYSIYGYQKIWIGENIAQGQTSIRQVINDWLKSPEHCKNLMSPNYKEMGVALVNTYWVQDFGGRYPFSSTASK
ncbi:CAP domain-containing protein [Pedobacter sp. HMF7647]|uniref:CAP domain-containing protein n=1 Tax=Hufsiella arboris TaxID=2695275 RepID=A0A7K1Y9S9_9SPHI|nr:CAP domain-containing protein [Hufsiella arboris]MXV51353.1 CAP domain-containing protein [Hufsiella arboris]